MTVPPPSPPPPPPFEEEASNSQPTASFLGQWLENEKKKSTAKTADDYAKYFDQQCTFPIYAHKIMADVGPLISLIESNNGNINEGNDDNMSANRTALGDMRTMASLCATYKNTAIMNRNEFQYKRAHKLKERRRKKEQQQSSNAAATDDNSNSPEKGNHKSDSSLQKPPYHPEYTPMPMRGNYLMATIHDCNYSLCFANAACPERTQKLVSCWKNAGPQYVKMMEQNGNDGFVCLEEREAVERCVGLSVQRVMKDILN